MPIAIELKNKFNSHLVNSALYKYKADAIIDILE